MTIKRRVLFLDTADLTQIEDALKKGVIDGITTNPSLISKVPKEGDIRPFIKRYVEHMRKIADLCRRYAPQNPIPLSVEVFTLDPREMLEQALMLKEKINYENLVIKITAPLIENPGWEELKVVKKLAEMNIDVNYTCCFSNAQLICAEKAGARYLSIFYNRLIDFYKKFDIVGDPLEAVRRLSKYLEETGSKAEIIAGSIRHPRDVTDCWNAGAHIVTAGHKHIINMNKHPKTDESVKGFLKDLEGWMKSQNA